MSIFSPVVDGTAVSLTERLRLRATVDRSIRGYLDAQGLLEVHVPSMVPVPGMEEHLTAFQVSSPHRSTWQPRWLHTSPEFAIKEMFGQIEADVYCLARVYRDEPTDRQHAPEFTMLEWYRHDADYHVLMRDVEALIRTVVQDVTGTQRPQLVGQHAAIDLDAPFRRISWVEAFAPFLSSDPLTARRNEWAEALRAHGIHPDADWDLETLCSMLWAEVIEATFVDQAVILYGFPADQAALARLSADDPQVAERFEVYVPGPWDRAPGWGGIEVANAFSELIDPVEQRARFERCMQRRSEMGVPPFSMPEDLLAGLEEMGTTAGIALGVDRMTLWIAQTLLGWDVSVYDFYCTRRDGVA